MEGMKGTRKGKILGKKLFFSIGDRRMITWGPMHYGGRPAPLLSGQEPSVIIRQRLLNLKLKS